MSIAAYTKSINVKTTGSTVWLECPANNATLTLNADVLDDTDMTSTGFRSRIIGLRDWSISIPSWYDDTNTALTTLRSAWLARTKLDVQYLANGTSGFQGTCFVESFSLSGDVGSLEQADVSLVPAAPSLTTV
jgi:predicted secreted protein